MNMFGSIIEDAKRNFISGTTVTRLILINVAIFIVINIFYVFFNGWNPELYQTVIKFLAIPADPVSLLYKPWTIITSMFLHEGFFHLLWNMLFLYFFGRIIGDLIGDHKILPIYILGGLVGAIIFMLSAQVMSTVSIGSYALGASGAIMAIVVATGVLSPEYEMRLILIGNVKLKYIVAALVFIDFVGTAGMNNTGGHFAHLGGALMGWLYIYGLRRGYDLGTWVESIETWIRDRFNSRHTIQKPQFTVVHRQAGASKQESPKTKSDIDQEVDRILDKIKVSGYESLTKSEKETLFQASKR